MATRTMTVADGYNGDTVELDIDGVVRFGDCGNVLLQVVGRPHLVRWVSVAARWARICDLAFGTGVTVDPPLVDADDIRPLLVEG